MKKVTMYTKVPCAFCRAAKALLGEYGVTPVEIRIDCDRDQLQEMVQKTNGMRSVPQIFIGNQHVGGYDQLMQLHRADALTDMLGN